MSNQKSDKDKKRSSTETARRVWLAGVGAYGRAFSEAQEAIKDVTGKGSDVFDELVKKGEMMEMVAQKKGKDILGKANVSNFEMPDLHMDERIKSMRSRLKRADPDGELAARMDVIEAKLDKILAVLDKKPAAKKRAPAKRTTTQKTTAKKTSLKPKS